MLKNNTTKPAFTHNDYEIIEREVLFQGMFRFVRYQIRHRLFNGGWTEPFTRETMERFSSAAILPYDPILDRVILIEQFRIGCLANPPSPWVIEIPAGLITDKKAPDIVAQNEAQEEAGCDILKLEPICEYFVSPGAENEYLYLYCGKVDASHIGGVHGLEHESEDIRVMNVTFDEALAKLRGGEIKTSPAIISLQWLQLHRERLQTTWK